MDHMLQLRVEPQSSPKLCNDRGGVASSADDTSRVTLLALAAIASLALFLSSFSMTMTSSSQSSSTTLPARLLAAGGSIFTSKTALFVLCNVVIVLLAADYRCRFATAASADDAASSSGEPGGVMEKQAQQQHQVQVQVQVEQCAVFSCSESLGDHNDQEGEDRSTMSAKTLPDEEQLSELELVRLGEEDSSRSTLEEQETVDDVEEPACETAQELDGLEISELNKKFDEFIRSRRIKWVKEEAYLLLCEV